MVLNNAAWEEVICTKFNIKSTNPYLLSHQTNFIVYQSWYEKLHFAMFVTSLTYQLISDKVCKRSTQYFLIC